MGAHAIPLETRFWSKVDRAGQNGCWLWTSTILRGYGQIALSRDGARRQRRVWAHRVAWELTHGRPVPAGMVICHHCDNPRCVNPAHLFLGTQQENVADAIRKGRLTGRPPIHGRRSRRRPLVAIAGGK